MNVPNILPVEVILLNVANSLSLKFKSLWSLNLLEAMTPTSAEYVIFKRIKEETNIKRSIRDNSYVSKQIVFSQSDSPSSDGMFTR